MGVVVATGARTAFGQIAAGLSERPGRTAFEVVLARFSRFLYLVAALLTVGIFAINVALSHPLIEALLLSLAIAIGIAPEMMPPIVTVSLSSGSKALAKKKVLVKRLVAIGPRQHRAAVYRQDRNTHRRRYHVPTRDGR